MIDFEAAQLLKPKNDAEEETQYGTMNRSEELSQYKGYVWLSSKVQSRRWKETALSLPQFMLSAALYEVCALTWRRSEESNIIYYYWLGLGAFIGAFVGHMLILLFVEKYDIFRELEEASIISLSIIFGPSTSLPWIKYACSRRGISFTVAFFLIWCVAFISYFGFPFLFRALFQRIKFGETRWLQTSTEVLYDFYSSSSVGLGYACMYATDHVSGNWLSIFEITSNDSWIVAILLVVSAFTVGFLTLQTLQNLLLPATWTDDNQIVHTCS